MRIVTAWIIGAALVPGLLALEWEERPGYRTAPLPKPAAGAPGFTRMAPSQTGINFTNFISEERFKTNQVLLNGSGIAAADVDGDGWCDLYVCRLGGPNVLYRNLGQWRFEDVTAKAGVSCGNLDSTGAAFADLDGDGDFDLVVNTVGGGTHIFINDGKGHFTERLPALNPGRAGMSLALGDYDGDGFLDLYVANYRTSALMDMPGTRIFMRNQGGRQVVATVNGRSAAEPDLTNRFVVGANGGVIEMGEEDVLYRNVGGTNFARVPFTGGTFFDEAGKVLEAPPFDWGLSVMFRDINQDGRPDLYVCNDFDTPERIWLNRGQGRFQAIAPLALRKSSLFSMGADFADINRDGWDDFFVLDMLSPDRVLRLTTMGDRKPHLPVPGEMANRPSYMMNTLFLNRGNGTYAEIAQAAGVAASDWSWATVFLDVDLDGWEDLLISNGHERAARDMDVIEKLRQNRSGRGLSPGEILEARKIFPRLATPNMALRNRRDATFEDKSAEWHFDERGVSHGIALADLDNDGDLDVIVNHLNAPLGLYRSEAAAPRVHVTLRGKRPNTAGVGARIEFEGGPVTQTQEIMAGGRYLSSDAPARTFSAVNMQAPGELRVHWPGGRRSVVAGIEANRAYEIFESDAPEAATPAEAATNRPSLFVDVSAELNHTHYEPPFDDFARQPLLPHKLSQAGPGVAWIDLDGDGWDDLVIGTGQGGALGVFHNELGRLTRWKAGAVGETLLSESMGLLPWPGTNGQEVLVALAHYETPPAGSASRVRSYSPRNPHSEECLAGNPPMTGVLASADLNGDGHLELFVGGGIVPGRYPETTPAQIYRRSGAGLVLDPENTRALASLSLVQGAVFSDVDGDGDSDLIVACSWSSIRLFENQAGRLVEATVAWGLDRLSGWWSGIATGDFNGDGRPDLVVGNWGRNSPYQMHRTQPLQLFSGDLDGDGVIELIESHFDAGLKKRVSELGWEELNRGMPFLAARWSSHADFARASLHQLFGEQVVAMAEQRSVNWLETTLFLNRGKHFEARALPTEAQWAPVFGLAVADFDGDGALDLFLAQNFFAVRPGTPRYDGGSGLLLRGKGNGSFEAMTPQESGLAIHGEQRGCAAADFDLDGRMDLVVSQNGAATKLLKNRTARPGLLIRVAGPPGNPQGIGSQMRMSTATEAVGPVYEVQAGSGYLSSSPLNPVIASDPRATHLLVRFPGGGLERWLIPPGSTQLTVRTNGVVSTASPP